MEAKHTPGPWFYGVAYEPERGAQPLTYRGPGYYENAGILAGEETVAGCDEYDVFGPKRNSEEREANVRLICAAPDLLAALETFMRLGTMDDQGAIDAARAALAKARGG